MGQIALAANQLPADAVLLFPEHDFEPVSLEEHRGVIIERVLERGTWEQVRWLFATYGETEVAEWVQEHGFRLPSRRSFALWRLVLGVGDYVAPDWAVEARGMEDENTFGLWEGQCQACEMWTRVNDMSLCQECDAKIQRDLIRARKWEYVAAAFGLDKEGRERLRAEVIHQYGAANELIANRQAE